MEVRIAGREPRLLLVTSPRGDGRPADPHLRGRRQPRAGGRADRGRDRRRPRRACPRSTTRTPSSCASSSAARCSWATGPLGPVTEVHLRPGQRRARGGRAPTARRCSCPFTADAGPRARPRRAPDRHPPRPAGPGRARRRADRRLHALPRVVRLDAPAPPPGERRAHRRPRAALLLAARHHAAAPGPGRRLALRRRPRHGAARRRDGRRPRGRLRRAGRAACRTSGAWPSSPRAGAPSPTPSPASWPPSPSSCSCAGATRASTSASTGCSPTTSSAWARSCSPAARWRRWRSSTRWRGASTGALGNAESLEAESFSEALGGGVEHPHYTRPAEFLGHEVPPVLLSGRPRRRSPAGATSTCALRAAPERPSAAPDRASAARGPLLCSPVVLPGPGPGTPNEEHERDERHREP